MMRTSVRSGSRGARSADCVSSAQAEPAPRAGVPAEAALDHAAVEVEGRVARAEPERALRAAERLLAAAVPGERPGEHVVALDRRPGGARPARQLERLAQPDPVVDPEERELEIRVDAVRGLEPLDRADQLDLLARAAAFAARRRSRSASVRDELRQRHGLGGLRARRDRARRCGRGPPRPSRALRARTGSRARPPARSGTPAAPARARRGRSGACRSRRASTRSAPARCRRRRARAPSPRAPAAAGRAARGRTRCARSRRGSASASTIRSKARNASS